LTLFLLNRDLNDGVEVTIDARNFGTLKVQEAEELHDNDLKAINTKSDPLRVKPKPINDISVSGGKITVSLKAASWNVIKLAG
jgi:alpha-N-arabinofuranosidase